MKSIIHSSVPVNYLTTPHPAKVIRVENTRNALDEEIQNNIITACKCNRDEVCGFITDKEDVIYVPNSHREPHWNFHMSAEDIDEALQIICKINGENVMGVFHTHPNNVPWPTPVDINGWPNRDLGWRYFIGTNHEIVEWAKPR